MDPLTYAFFIGSTAVVATTIGAAVPDVTDTRAGLIIASNIINEQTVFPEFTIVS